MLFIVGLSHVIATSAACVQVSFQQIQLLCSKCPPLALTHAQSLVKVTCFHKVQWLHFTGEVDTFIIVWCDVSSEFCTPKTTKISSFFTESFYKNQGVFTFLKHSIVSRTFQNLICCLCQRFYVLAQCLSAGLELNNNSVKY